MTIETELIHKWGIGDDPVFGSGSLKDIQTLCNECDRLRKVNDNLLSEVERLTMELNAVTNGEYTKQDVELERLRTELGRSEERRVGKECTG